MTEQTPAEDIAALIELHRGLPRKGPGDPTFTRDLLRKLPPLAAHPRIADLGCGSGAGALLLAQHFQSGVMAVDAVPVFIEELKVHAKRAGLGHLVTPICADMAALDWPHASIDLLWSEGAAYNLGFANALRIWRPLMASGGLAVISEMTWFTETTSGPARDFWRSAYPAMGTETQNVARARDAGYGVLSTERLPSQAWWDNYYEPLRDRMRQLGGAGLNQAVLRETEAEMALFEKHSEDYGYAFYILERTDRDSP